MGNRKISWKNFRGGVKQIGIERIEAFIDNNKSIAEYMGKKVFSPEEVVNMEYDAIIVANLFSREIYLQCRQIGIDLGKIIFLYNNCVLEDINKDYDFIESIIGGEFAELVKRRYHVVREEFAQYLNYSFPDRKCYLFDTFDGFDANEALNEIKNGNCTDAFVEAYKQTNTSEVLRKMKYLDNVVMKQGFFPESLDGLDEKFAFVSIDVDFEESIYEGLKYFYPRVSEGGYIFVHDYNSSLMGVEKAVDRYEKELGVYLHKMPLCDANGTLVITK